MSRSPRIRKAQEEGSYAATFALIDLGIDQRKPIDVFSAIQSQDIWLLFGAMGNAFGMYLNEGHPGIFINTRRPPSVQRLTAAHEFGHARLGHEGSIDEREIIEGGQTSLEQEAAAQAFALDFLMPETLVETLWDTLELPSGNRLTPREVYLLSLEIGISYRACIVQLRQIEKIPRSKAEEFLSWQPKKVKKELGGGIGPADPWADVWPLEISDNGRSIQIRVNDELRLKLPETPSTGFAWDSREDKKQSALLLINDEFETVGGVEAVGGGGHRFLSYRATDATQETLDLYLQRPWEAPGYLEKFCVTCRISQGPAGPDGVGIPTSLVSSFLSQGDAG